MSVGEKRARPNRRDEGSGSSAQGMVLGVPQTRGSDFTIEHLEQGGFFFWTGYVLNRGLTLTECGLLTLYLLPLPVSPYYHR